MHNVSLKADNLLHSKLNTIQLAQAIRGPSKRWAMSRWASSSNTAYSMSKRWAASCQPMGKAPIPWAHGDPSHGHVVTMPWLIVAILYNYYWHVRGLNIRYEIIITHSLFHSRLKTFFFCKNPFHCSLSFSSSELTTWFPRLLLLLLTYLLLLFSFSVLPFLVVVSVR